jgi:hypothetical protein
MQSMGRAVLNACRAFAVRHPEDETRGWGNLNGIEQLSILETMNEELIRVNPRFVFFENYVRLWPLEFILQPKWTQRSRRIRTAHAIAQARRLIRANQ